MPETGLYNNYLVAVAPPKPNTEGDGGPGMYTQSPLANGTPWIPGHKTLVVSLRRQSHFKPALCAVLLSVLAVVAVVLIISALFSQPNRNQNSTVKFSETSIPVTLKSTVPAKCGTRPAYSARRRKRIVNGEISEEGQWPWQVAVEYRGIYRCGGVVIGADWVMTAAHCVYNKHRLQRLDASKLTIRAGSILRNQTSEIDPNVQVVELETFYIHPRYLAERRIDNYDVAMLKLSRQVDWTSGFVMPVCLPEGGMEFQPGTECYLASWGSVKPRLTLRIEQMHVAMPLLSDDECLQFASTISPRHILQVNQQKFCAGILPKVSAQRAGACILDSGSGLVCLNEDTRRGALGSWYVVGLVSGGKKCGEVNYFTNVTSVMDFIKPILDGNLPPQSFQCDKGQRSIWSNQVCDGQFDCDDLSDEQQCECSERQFRCDNGLCKMEFYYHCNGVDDCGDDSDERNCSYFECGDNTTISPRMVCDGEIDCYTGKDETNCECSPAQFHCDNAVCIPGFWRCDGFDDCLDASDEINCNCTEDQMDCGNTRCVPKNLLCDDVNDCGNFKDEANCTCIPDRVLCKPLNICLPTNLSSLCEDQMDSYEEISNSSRKSTESGLD